MPLPRVLTVCPMKSARYAACRSGWSIVVIHRHYFASELFVNEVTSRYARGVPKDKADLHVERWRDHWIDVNFDDDVEAMTVRVGEVQRYLRQAKQVALGDAGLQDFEYDTLHVLMIRDTPGRASPGDLGRDLGVSGAGMTEIGRASC